MNIKTIIHLLLWGMNTPSTNHYQFYVPRCAQRIITCGRIQITASLTCRVPILKFVNQSPGSDITVISSLRSAGQCQPVNINILEISKENKEKMECSIQLGAGLNGRAV
jgi:hypothetical protein